MKNYWDYHFSGVFSLLIAICYCTKVWASSINMEISLKVGYLFKVKTLYKIGIKGNFLSKAINSGNPEFLHANNAKYGFIKIRKIIAQNLKLKKNKKCD